MVQEGQRFRVKRDYVHLNHSFRRSEEVVFSTSAYSANEGVTRHWFQGSVSNDTSAWHAYDGDAAAEEFHATSSSATPPNKNSTVRRHMLMRSDPAVTCFLSANQEGSDRDGRKPNGRKEHERTS
jgi:hypothetical protein